MNTGLTWLILMVFSLSIEIFTLALFFQFPQCRVFEEHEVRVLSVQSQPFISMFQLEDMATSFLLAKATVLLRQTISTEMESTVSGLILGAMTEGRGCIPPTGPGG